jgi:hypothetical protein
MILGMVGYAAGGLAAIGSDFTPIANPTAAGAEYKVVSSTQSGLVVPVTLAYSEDSSASWSMFGDAVQAASTPPPPIPEYPLGLPILTVLLVLAYSLIKRRTRN